MPAHVQGDHKSRPYERFISLVFSCFLLVLSPAASHAQITLDGSLGPKGALAGPNYTIDANVGKQVGGNLFHSFGEFNVNTGESATFTGPSTVDNIIGRVTGGNLSLIDGTLRSTIPDANLYLVNPSGVLFGPNASLDVDGSFHVSTADYLKLGENGRFDATAPNNTLLTSAPPEAFGFLAPNPAPISIQGSQLAVPEGKALSVVGGDLQITGGKLFAPSGQINLASVASSGEVIPNTPGQSADLHVASFSRLGRIEMSDGANIQSSGQAGGSVVIRGGQLLVDRSDIGADTRGDVDGSTTGVDINVQGDAIFTQEAFVSALGHGSGRVGDINIEADNVAIRDGAVFLSRTAGPTDGGLVKITARDSLIVSGPVSFVGTLTTEQGRNGGDIVLSAMELTVEKGGAVQTATDVWTTDQGAGDAGDVVVEAGRVTLRDGGSRLSSITAGAGQGGDIAISADESVLVTGQTRHNAAVIATLSANSGNAGHIQIATPDLRLEGGFMSVATQGAGRAGNIEIDTARATLTSGAIIDSSTIGSGQGGEIIINATESIRLSGFSVDNEPNLISSATFSNGNAGRIFLSTPLLTLQQCEIGSPPSPFTIPSVDIKLDARGAAGSVEVQVGRLVLTGTGQATPSSSSLDRATIDSTSQSGQQGGRIKITASESIVLSGPGARILSNAEASGLGGNIDLYTKNIHLTDGATISSTSLATGNAGGVSIMATEAFRSENSRVTTEAKTADGGNIALRAGSLARLNNSQITATVTGGQGKGGNIVIEPTFTVLDQSTITANAFGGPGGNVHITSDVFLASPDSSVTASSALGVDGLVDIQSPITSISGSFAPLPETFVNTSELLPVRCAARLRDGQSSSFVVRGRDALPPTPDGALPSPLLRRDKTNTVGSSAAAVSGWDEAGLSQVNVEVDCLK